jgi:hypothetical protein
MANDKKFVVRHGIITDNVQFNTGTSDTPLKGEILWNEEDGTLDVGLTDTGVVLQSGQVVHYRVSNVSGSSIPNGTLVMANGTNGNSGRINVVPAVADGSVPSKYIMGIVTETIPNDSDGYVTHFGKVRGIDTSMWAEGDVLYADPTVNGGLTNIAPSAPNLKTVIAIVINSSATVGTIFVRPTYGSNLANDELVELTNPQDGDLIAFNGSAGRFENVSQSGLQVTGFTGSQGIQGNIGFTGSQGDQGNIGYTGSRGDQGNIGYTGSQGDQGNIGFTGSQGIQGNIGFTGSQGDQGNIGYTGSQGDQGNIGYTGSQGDQGNIGYTGSQGDQGNIGFTGSQGDQGNIGYTGSQGDQGNIGYTGSQGDQGNIGFTGSLGATGFTGSQGDQGNIGFTGSLGATGFTGSVGFTGSKGNDGNFGGATFDYTFDNNTTNSDPGIGKLKFNNSTLSSATQLYIDDQDDGSNDIQSFLRTIDDSTSTIKGHFRISNKFDANDFSIFTISSISEETGYFIVNCSYVSGPATSFSLNEDIIITFARTGDKGDTGFTGSRGLTGFTGSQGDQGNIGFTGSLGATGFTGSVGFAGSQGIQGVIGFTGSKGDQGNIGFTGSQGIQGATGFTGSQGIQGVIGFTGSQGIQGVIGFTGSKGDQGNIGFTGSQGIQGVIGFTGSKGDQGNIGFTGSRGATGFTGSQGIQGVIGFTGSKGDQGNIGFTGSQGIQGATGFTGSQGIQGVIGFTGSQGIQGVIGFTGSKGDQGNIGFTGSQGIQGVIGFTGSQGIQGVIGFTGSKGDQGNIGFTGSQGIQGVIGFTGSKGDQGNIGFTGSQGEDGVGGLDVSNMVGYSVTTTLASGFTAPSTSGLHYLISSIHVTNISTTAGWITAEQSLSGGTPIQLANQIPVPAGSSIELLKRFKVMNPSDILNFQANANSSIHVTISYFIDNSNKYFRSGTDLTSTSVTDVFASSNTNGTYIESCMVTTDSSLDEKVTVTWTNSSNTIQGYFSYDLIVPANGSVELLEKPKFIANGNKIRAQAGSANAIEVLVAGRNR